MEMKWRMAFNFTFHYRDTLKFVQVDIPDSYTDKRLDLDKINNIRELIS